MPRGKNTVVMLVCAEKTCPKCRTVYVTRINKKSMKKIELKKYCPACNKHTKFVSKEIKKGGSKRYL